MPDDNDKDGQHVDLNNAMPNELQQEDPDRSDSHSYGYRFSDESVDKRENLIARVGKIVIKIIVVAAAVMILSAIIGLVVYGPNAADVGIFGTVSIIAMVGGIAAPVVLFAVWGIFYGAWMGGQALSKYGFLVSIPFAIWFFGGMFLCFPVFNDLINGFMYDVLSIRSFSVPLWPFWVYLVVMGVLILGWFLLGALRGVSFKPRSVQRARKNKP